MKSSVFIFFGLMLLTDVQAQKKIAGSTKIDLNKLILDIATKGDSALRANDFLLTEKYFIEACSYTDTLVLLALGNHRSSRYSFTRKKIQQQVQLYEKLARLYQMAGNIKKSDEQFTKSIKQRQLLFEARSVERVYPYIGLGQLYFQVEDFDKALGYFTEGSRLLDRATTTNYNFDVLRYQLYGFHFETSLQKGRIKEAFKYLQRYFYALNTISPTSEQIATAFEMKARYYLISGNLEQASNYLKRAEKFLPQSNVAFSSAEVKVLRTKALAFWIQHQFDSTSLTFKALLNVYKTNIQKNFPALSEHEREQFFITLKSDFDLFNSFVAESIRSGSASEDMMITLYNTQLFTKALLLNEITKSKRNIETSKDQELILKMTQWQKAKESIATLYYTNKKASAEISSLEQQINGLEKEINQKSSYLSKASEDIQWHQIRDRLKPQEAALEIMRTKRFHIDSISKNGIRFSNEVQYLVLSVRPNSTSPDGFLLPYGTSIETRYISNYRNSIRQQIADTISYGLYWKPILNRLAKCSTVFISADGAYNQINLNVLLNPISGQYVLDEINIFSVTNTKDILQPTETTNLTSVSLFGRPDYSGKMINNTSPSHQNRSVRALGDRTIMDFADQDFADLPGTEEEVEFIRKIFSDRRWKAQTFLGNEASEENIKTLQSPAVLHIATHGFFLEDDGRHINSMIRSGIILSGIKNRSDQSSQDGVLTAYETTNLALDKTDLVVLSACETGLGEIKNGEGVYGLQRGLKVAGAKNLLMSLWKVDDKATAELMREFYQNWLSGMTIHGAFRQAQLDLREKYKQPFYWGAFILVGN